MAYSYATEKNKLFTEENQGMFLSVRDRACRLTSQSGAATMGKLISGETGDCWTMMACVDRLVELGELFEVPNTVYTCGQDRLFVRKS